MSVKAGFDVRKTYDGEKDFDSTYKDIKLIKKLVPLGEADENGEIPYIEKEVEIITETPIKDVIARDSEECGIEAFLKPYRVSGVNPPDVMVDDKIQDFTQFDNAGDLRESGKVDALWASLPPDLQAKYGSPANLLRDFTENALAEYIASKVYKPEEKKEKEEVKKDE